MSDDTLILWKAPVVSDPGEAEALVRPYYATFMAGSKTKPSERGQPSVALGQM